MEQTRRRGRGGRQLRSDSVFDDVKPSCPVVCGLRMAREEPRKAAVQPASYRDQIGDL